MQVGCEFKVGQLVRYRAWYDGEGAWVSADNQAGVVLEIIEIRDIAFGNKKKDMIIYDVKVYWIGDGTIETVPDLLLDDYETEYTDFI